ncbi:MAG: phospho-N-acetylmuramoyl-pentapeptide-transferase [Clostridia bacterium]|nr:phospho-N-acetylmuramoyl-pentapeptide-transferase [Clostridia bacterium]
MDRIIVFLVSAVAVYLATFLILKKLIPVLKSKKIGQKIYEIGPRWHAGKEGTPIMGGVSFIMASAAAVAVYAVISACRGDFSAFLPALLGYLMALANALIGFFDDYTKLIKKQNQGFKAWQKLALQLVAAAAYIAAMKLCGCITTALPIPFTDFELELGVFYYPIAVLVVAGIVNAANLTDGIDGLCSSVTAVIALFFGIAGIVFNASGLALLSGVAFGGCIGFLMYNFYPAKIFMGDTGSLFLGGMAVAMAFTLGEPLIVFIAGIIYICEVLSDILQVGYFKLTHGKRIFKMAPIHHHFEKCGWSEIKIVAVFSAVTLVGCIVAWLGI